MADKTRPHASSTYSESHNLRLQTWYSYPPIVFARQSKMKGLRIKAYEDKFHKQFRDISSDWLLKYDLYEDSDSQLLDHPQEYLDRGASIFLAHLKDEIVGTVSINPISRSVCEILKLGVVDTYKGFGIGEKLMRLCIETCQEKEVELITLETNSKLESAIRLYAKLGFVHVELIDSLYASADVKMELRLRR
jgi:putative acetyltransferase